jgi:hypothetical protein
MKEFNLERALAGEPVITRDGRPVTQLTLFEIGGNFPLKGVVDRNFGTFTKTGSFHENRENHPWDLFMAPEKKFIWVNIYDYERGDVGISLSYSSYEEAVKNISTSDYCSYIKTIEITNEP